MSKTRISRRRFLALTGGALGATALACGGLITLGTQQPAIEFTQSNCGKDPNMADQVLIAYASRCGATGEVAQAIGQVWCNQGMAVDVRLAKEVSDLSHYRAVFLGSAIRMGRWLPEAVDFVKKHQAALSRLPVTYFVVCATLKKDTEENRRKVAAYLDPVYEILKPANVGLFAGKVDFGKLSFLDRQIANMVKMQEGDFRNWDAIRTWATQMSPAA